MLFNGFYSVLNDPKTYIYLLIVPYFIYKIITSKLVLNKGRFIMLGKRNGATGIRKDMQDIIMDYYARKSKI